jgi:antitoxin MazE
MQVHAKIQKWGNGLALRVSGAMREIPHFKEGTEVDVEITEKGLTVTNASKHSLFFRESDLIDNLTVHNSHTDLIAKPQVTEIGE